MSDAKPTDRLDPGLARRLHRALTAGREELFQMIQDPAPEVLRALLKNPSLGDDHLLALLTRRDLPEDLFKAVFRLERVESSHRLKVALVYNPGTPGTVVQSLLPQLYLFELVNLCYLPGVTPDQKVAAERVLIQRLPTTALGNKLTLARRGTSAVVGEILKEGDARPMEACLANPRLKEVSILQFLNGARATAETISAIARHPRWKSRPNLRLAILKNRRTPAVWFTLFLPLLQTLEIQALLASRRLGPNQKQLVQVELKRRGHG
jgi:hypothetical protein